MTEHRCKTTHYTGCDCHEAARDARIAQLTAERDAAYKTIGKLNRRAQQAERLALHAMRVGLHEAEGMRALVHHWRRRAQERLLSATPIKTDFKRSR